MPTRLSKATILVVDDDVPLREVLVRQLRDEGYSVLEAGYGMEALYVARNSEEQIQLVLSDIRMPGILGTELARRLMAQNPEVRIVLMSAHPVDELTTFGDRRGIITVLPKPFERHTMLALVRLLLNQPPPSED
jgi:two-component system, cell cycle sensor histidine kinase and response regulator CckA